MHHYSVQAVGKRARCSQCGYQFVLPNAIPQVAPSQESNGLGTPKKPSDSMEESTAEMVIGDPEQYLQASVTALSVCLALLYVALIIIGIILIHHLVGIEVTLWIFLPLVVVWGRKTLVHIAFLLTGKVINLTGQAR